VANSLIKTGLNKKTYLRKSAFAMKPWRTTTSEEPFATVFSTALILQTLFFYNY